LLSDDGRENHGQPIDTALTDIGIQQRIAQCDVDYSNSMIEAFWRSAIALGVKVAQMGHRVYFTSAMDLAHKLTKAVETNRLHRQLNALMQPKLLILDEVGYLSFDALQASLLFQVICNRYQKHQSIVLTSNKAFSEWGQVFSDDAIMASAALDRLLHRSTVINVRGESFRLRQKKQAGSNHVHEIRHGSSVHENGHRPDHSAE